MGIESATKDGKAQMDPLALCREALEKIDALASGQLAEPRDHEDDQFCMVAIATIAESALDPMPVGPCEEQPDPLLVAAEAAKDKRRLESRTIRLYAPTEFAEHVIFEDVDLRAAIDDAMERHAIQMASYERQISVWLHDRLAHSDGEAIREASLERHISRPGNE